MHFNLKYYEINPSLIGKPRIIFFTVNIGKYMGCFFPGIGWEIYWMLFLVIRIPACSPRACLQCLSEDCKPSNILLLTFLSLPSAILIIVIIDHILLVFATHSKLFLRLWRATSYNGEQSQRWWFCTFWYFSFTLWYLSCTHFNIAKGKVYSLERQKTNTNTAPQILNTKVKSRENLHYREHSPSRSAGAAGRRPRSR